MFEKIIYDVDPILFYIDQPSLRSTDVDANIGVRGWILTNQANKLMVKIDDGEFQQYEYNQLRGDVLNHFSITDGSKQSFGFDYNFQVMYTLSVGVLMDNQISIMCKWVRNTTNCALWEQLSNKCMNSFRSVRYQHYLSFGFNCELAFVLEKLNLLTNSVFSWVAIPDVDTLLYAISEPNKILCARVLPDTCEERDMLFCQETNLGFHGRIKIKDMKGLDGNLSEDVFAQALNELRSRVCHLQKKQNDAICGGNALVIVKYIKSLNNHTPYECALLLKQALEKRYSTVKVTVLCVMLHGSHNDEWTEDGVYGRCINSYAYADDIPNTINYDHWAKVLNEFI